MLSHSDIKKRIRSFDSYHLLKCHILKTFLAFSKLFIINWAALYETIHYVAELPL